LTRTWTEEKWNLKREGRKSAQGFKSPRPGGIGGGRWHYLVYRQRGNLRKDPNAGKEGVAEQPTSSPRKGGGQLTRRRRLLPNGVSYLGARGKSSWPEERKAVCLERNPHNPLTKKNKKDRTITFANFSEKKSTLAKGKGRKNIGGAGGGLGGRFKNIGNSGPHRERKQTH